MLIGVVAVTCKEPTYLGIHRMTYRFWNELCGRQVWLPAISESQLREQLKQLASSLESLQIHFSDLSCGPHRG
jgi:hypothetical protein